MWSKRIRVAAGGLATSGILAILPATPATAVTCWGDYCSGKDPMATGCANDAVVVASKDTGSAVLQVRWSPTCKTNWARLYVYPTRSLAGGRIVARQSTGYEQWADFKTIASSTPVSQTVWTPMIYSPTKCVKAGAVHYPGWTWNYVWTACV